MRNNSKKEDWNWEKMSWIQWTEVLGLCNVFKSWFLGFVEMNFNQSLSVAVPAPWRIPWIYGWDFLPNDCQICFLMFNLTRIYKRINQWVKVISTRFGWFSLDFHFAFTKIIIENQEITGTKSKILLTIRNWNMLRKWNRE